MANQSFIASEFDKIPFELLIATPLLSAVKAQAANADATRLYIERMLEPDTRRPLMLDLSLEHRDEGGTVHGSQVRAPLLALTPVPHLCIETLDVKFKYEVSEVVKESRSTQLGAELGASSGAALSPFVTASLRGSVSSQAAQESTTNHSGCLDIHVRAGQAPISDGMAKLLTLLANSVSVSPVPAGGATPNPPPPAPDADKE
jgi:hypothetical protein